MKKTVDTMKCIKIISITVIFTLIAMSLSSCIMLHHKFDSTVRILLHSRVQIYDGQSYLCDATPCVGMVANPALNDSRTAGIFILLSND